MRALLIVILVLLNVSYCYGNAVIHLKDGRKIEVEKYRREAGKITFEHNKGVYFIKTDNIDRIVFPSATSIKQDETKTTENEAERNQICGVEAFKKARSSSSQGCGFSQVKGDLFCLPKLVDQEVLEKAGYINVWPDINSYTEYLPYAEHVGMFGKVVGNEIRGSGGLVFNRYKKVILEDCSEAYVSVSDGQVTTDILVYEKDIMQAIKYIGKTIYYQEYGANKGLNTYIKNVMFPVSQNEELFVIGIEPIRHGWHYGSGPFDLIVKKQDGRLGLLPYNELYFSDRLGGGDKNSSEKKQTSFQNIEDVDLQSLGELSKSVINQLGLCQECLAGDLLKAGLAEEFSCINQCEETSKIVVSYLSIVGQIERKLEKLPEQKFKTFFNDNKKLFKDILFVERSSLLVSESLLLKSDIYKKLLMEQHSESLEKIKPHLISLQMVAITAANDLLEAVGEDK